MNLEELGLSKETLIEMVVTRIVHDYEGRDFDSSINHRVEQALLGKVDERIALKVDGLVPAVVDQLINNAEIFSPKERYGERSKEKLSFTDYLCKMAEKYLTATVDYDGRESSYSGKAQPRIVWMVHQHLESNIRKAIEDVIKTSNTILGNSIQAVVVDALARIQAAIKVQIK